MKMCNAFSKDIDTTLIGVISELKSDPFHFYGIPRCFRLNLIRKYRGILGSFFQIFRILILAAAEKEALFYGRHTIALFLLSKINYQVAYESHQMPPNNIRAFIEALMFKQKKFVKLVVISHALKRDYLKRFLSLKEDMIVVSHDAADLPKSKPHKKQNKEKVVGYVGHLYTGRGIDLILKLAKRRPNFHFELVGGKQEDVTHWRSRSANLSNVVFRGHVPPKDLHSFYKKFDIVLAPYQLGANQDDGKTNTNKWMSPMKIFEYMSFGLPIICSDIPVLREILNKNNAILVPPDDLDAWCSALDKLENSHRRKKLGTNAYKDLRTNYTWEIRAKNILNELFYK